MRERQLGRHLADDGEERTRARELDLEVTDTRACPQCLRRADAEDPEAGELLRIRLVAGRMEELEQPDGRMAERQRRRDPAALGQALGGEHAHRSGLCERRLGELAHAAQVDIRREAVRPLDPEAVVVEPPDERGGRADDGRRDPRELGRGPSRVERGRERLARELERRLRERRRRLSRRERPEAERDLSRRELRRQPLRLAERLARPVELDRCERSRDAHGNEQECVGGGASGGAPHDRRCGGELDGRRVRQLGGGKPRPLELGGERRRPREGDRFERLAGGAADDRELGSGPAPRGLHEVGERVGEPFAAGCGLGGPDERRQRLERDAPAR